MTENETDKISKRKVSDILRFNANIFVRQVFLKIIQKLMANQFVVMRTIGEPRDIVWPSLQCTQPTNILNWTQLI